MMPLCTMAKRPSFERWGWALTSVGAPWVAQRVCPMPIRPGTAAPFSVFSQSLAIRPLTFSTRILSASITAMPAES